MDPYWREADYAALQRQLQQVAELLERSGGSQEDGGVLPTEKAGGRWKRERGTEEEKEEAVKKHRRCYRLLRYLRECARDGSIRKAVKERMDEAYPDWLDTGELAATSPLAPLRVISTVLTVGTDSNLV